MKICDKLVRLFFSAIVVVALANIHVNANEKLTDEEQLLFLEISPIIGTVTQTDNNKTPVSVTVINKEKISLTPARNLYDVLEVYVPGLTYFSHFDATHLALRGLAVDRDYNLILLINGRMINQRSHDGVVTELENWDMNDIEKIEIIRGPGSVTYGPGAVAGVISITTKNAETANGLRAGFYYNNGYNSNGMYVSNGFFGKSYSLYIYGSYTQTEGYKNPKIYGYSVPNTAAYAGGGLINYYRDYENQPQVKLQAELNFLKEWKLWARYVTSGTTRMNVWNNLSWFNKGNYPGFNESPATSAKEAIVDLENNHSFNSKLELKSSISYSSIDCRRVDTGPFTPGAFANNYAENELLLKSLLRYTYSDTLKAAMGFEYSQATLGPGWGSSADEFILNDGVVYLSRPGSPASLYAEPSWYTKVYNSFLSLYNYALLAEVSKSISSKIDLMFSGRMDKYEASDMVFSPRVSVIYSMNKDNIFKLSLQRSVRANTLVQIAYDKENNRKSNYEEFNGVEFIYQTNINKNISSDISCFYSNVDLLGWGTSSDPGSASTQKQGNLKIIGLELVGKYKPVSEKYEAGLAHSFTKQIDFKLANGQQSSYISISDYYSGGTQFGVGNDRMNWSNQMTKLYAIVKPSGKVSLFGDMKIFWGYEGDKNWLKLQQALSPGAATDEAVKNVQDQGLFDSNVMLDLSAKYQATKHLSFTAYGLNIIRLTKIWRYSYIMQTETAVEEPTVFGIKADYKF